MLGHALASMINYSEIRSLHLEISTLCNASCPMCPRNIAGYDSDLGYPLHNMSVNEARQIFTVDFLKQISRILINGNFGDFVMNPYGLEIVKYFSDSNPTLTIEISTNGSARRWWSELASIPNLTIGFDLDGLADTHSLYRRNTSWDTVIKNAQGFINASGSAIWRMVEFDHNRHQIEECRRLSQELGFKKFLLIDDGRNKGPVYDRNGNYIYKIGTDPMFEPNGYPATVEIWNNWHQSGIDNRVAERSKIPIKSSVDCYSKKYSEIYVTATGEVYPCCWLGMYPKLQVQHGWQQDNDQVCKIVESNNALEVGLERAVKWFSEVENSWNKKSYNEGRLFKCDEYCGH